MKTTAPLDEAYRVIYTDHHDPFQVLGAHVVQKKDSKAVAVRAFLPGADRAWVVPDIHRRGTTNGKMVRLHEEGFFEVVLPSFKQVFPYQLKKQLSDGSTTVFRDSYSFLPMLTDFDTYLFNAGITTGHTRSSGPIMGRSMVSAGFSFQYGLRVHGVSV